MEGDVGFKSALSSVQHWRLMGEETALWLCDAIRCNPASCESPSVCLLVSACVSQVFFFSCPASWCDGRLQIANFMPEAWWLDPVTKTEWVMLFSFSTSQGAELLTSWCPTVTGIPHLEHLTQYECGGRLWWQGPSIHCHLSMAKQPPSLSGPVVCLCGKLSVFMFVNKANLSKILPFLKITFKISVSSPLP